MSLPEPPAGKSASPKPLDERSLEDKPSNTAPGDRDTESDSTLAESASSSPEDRPCGILTRNEIKHFKIIHEADEDCFKPTSYDLRLGRECVHVRDREGGFRDLHSGDSASLEPFGRLYFETREILKLPPNVAGRFDLKIGLAIQGLFVQVGTQVEPGYKGKLFGVIINTSSDPVDVFADAKLLTIEFHYLSGPVKEFPDPCGSLRQYLSEEKIGESKFKNASVVGTLRRDLQELEGVVRRDQTGWKVAAFAVGVAVTLLVTLLSQCNSPSPPRIELVMPLEPVVPNVNERLALPEVKSAKEDPTNPDTLGQEEPATQPDAPDQEADRIEGQKQ